MVSLFCFVIDFKKYIYIILSVIYHSTCCFISTIRFYFLYSVAVRLFPSLVFLGEDWKHSFHQCFHCVVIHMCFLFSSHLHTLFLFYPSAYSQFVYSKVVHFNIRVYKQAYTILHALPISVIYKDFIEFFFIRGFVFTLCRGLKKATY